MNPAWHDIIQRHIAFTTTAEEAIGLEAALTADAGLRTLYLDYMNLDVALGALAGAADRVHAPQEQRTARWLTWRPLAAAAACVALLLSGALLFSRKPLGPQLDLAATFASTEQAIAHLPAPPLTPLPEWMSPTAAMLDPAGLRPVKF
jgi:hypothetical protein